MRRFALLFSCLLVTGCASAGGPSAPAPVTPPSPERPAEQNPPSVPEVVQRCAEELAKLAERVAEAEGITLYHWKQSGRPCQSSSAGDYWLVAEGEALALPEMVEQVDQLQVLASLQEGEPILLLRGGPSPVYVASATAYYVVRLRAEGAELLRFEWRVDQYPQAMAAPQALYSSGAPLLDGTELRTSHRNPASGQTTINLTWLIDWERGVGTLDKLEEDRRDPNK